MPKSQTNFVDEPGPRHRIVNAAQSVVGVTTNSTRKKLLDEM